MRSYVCAILISVTLLAAGCARLAGRTDQQVATDVQNKINADTAFPDKQLTVSASQGVVTLSGNVSSDAARTAAANDAAHVDGVKTVVNNLAVVSPVPSAASEPEPQPQYEAQAGSNPQPARARPAPKPSPRAGWHRFGDSGPGSTSQSAKTHDSGAPAAVSSSNPSTADTPANNAAAVPPAPVTPPPPLPVTVPSGTQLSISLTTGLNSETAQVGDTFRASISRPVVVGGDTVIPTTADVEGRVVEVKSAGRFAGQSDLVLELTRLRMGGKSYMLTTDHWSKSGSSRGKSTATKVGGGAAVGAILGGIFGGGKGAAIGAAAGAGAGTGVSAAGRGQQIVLKPEMVLDFQLQNSISVVPGAKSQPMSSSPASPGN